MSLILNVLHKHTFVEEHWHCSCEGIWYDLRDTRETAVHEHAYHVEAELLGAKTDLLEDGNVFIQYKGTDICADIYCDCGTHLHVDEYHAYAVRCWNCKAIWELPQMLTAVKVTETQFTPLETEKDEDID